MKPGVQTTEFWVTALTVLGSLVSMLAGVIPAEYAAIASAVASGLYATSRGLAKKGGDAEARVLDVLARSAAERLRDDPPAR